VDFSWTTEQEALYSKSVRFAVEELDPLRAERGVDSYLDRSIWQQCGRQGLLELVVNPPASSTPALDLVSALRALEGFGYGCRDNGLALALSTQIWTVQHPIEMHGSDFQKEKYLARLSQGELIGSHAITEPDVGSDAYSLHTLATRVDGGYRISGRKVMITAAPIADVVLVFATVDPAKGPFGVTAFLVDCESEGCTVEGPVPKMGLTSVPMGHITFTDCFVPEENRLGPEGAGFALSTASLEFERTCILAPQIGALQRQLDETVRAARERKQFGKSIGKFQSVSNRIADMKVRLETARMMLYRTAWLKDNGKSITLESAMVKLLISETFLESSLDAIRTRGGSGYLVETGAERDLRDAVGGILYAGTSDIQRNIIARVLGL